MEQSHTQTPSKGSRQLKASSNTDRPNSARRGGRRGGRAGSNVQSKQAPISDVAKSLDASGSFDEHGNFVPSASTPKQTKRTHQKRNGADNQSLRTHAEQTASMMAQQPPFPQSPFTSTPPKQYYAGPAFHQSPAASALPMPRFLSKSMPKAGESAPSLLEHAENAADTESSSTGTSPEASPSNGQAKPYAIPIQSSTNSPLDQLFQAARAEKARQSGTLPDQRTASPKINEPKTTNMSSHWTSIYGNRPTHQRTASTDSSKGLFAMDPEHKPEHKIPSSMINTSVNPLPIQRTVSDGTQHLYHNHHGNQVYTAPESSIADHQLPKPSPVHSAQAASQAPVQHFSTHTPISRSLQNSPSHAPSASNIPGQGYHYGNKNLSPMFQAARTNSPRSQSSLRNQIHDERSAQASSGLPQSYQAIPFPQYNHYSPVPQNWSTDPKASVGSQLKSSVTDARQQQASQNRRTLAEQPLPVDHEEAKIQALTDNLRSMLKIPKA